MDKFPTLFSGLYPLFSSVQPIVRGPPIDLRRLRGVVY